MVHSSLHWFCIGWQRINDNDNESPPSFALQSNINNLSLFWQFPEVATRAFKVYVSAFLSTKVSLSTVSRARYLFYVCCHTQNKRDIVTTSSLLRFYLHQTVVVFHYEYPNTFSHVCARHKRDPHFIVQGKSLCQTQKSNGKAPLSIWRAGVIELIRSSVKT